MTKLDSSPFSLAHDKAKASISSRILELEELLNHFFQPLYFTEEEMGPEKCDMSRTR